MQALTQFLEQVEDTCNEPRWISPLPDPPLNLLPTFLRSSKQNRIVKALVIDGVAQIRAPGFIEGLVQPLLPRRLWEPFDFTYL